MTLCSDGHDEICYDEGPRNVTQCPACALKGEIAELKDKIEELEKTAGE